tara:strand:+ start:2195 stop:2374 length:180 start_codon:yes stop_codon:yes gene_type:complete
MKIQIIEIASEAIISEQEVNLSGLNYRPSVDEYNDEAWRAAVDDGLVSENERKKYRFHS